MSLCLKYCLNDYIQVESVNGELLNMYGPCSIYCQIYNKFNGKIAFYVCPQLHNRVILGTPFVGMFISFNFSISNALSKPPSFLLSCSASTLPLLNHVIPL